MSVSAVNDTLNSRHSNDGIVSELPIEEIAFAELVSEFIDRAREKLVEMHRSYSEQNWHRLAKLAHWMKGSGGMAGFPALTESARTLETLIRSVDVELIGSGLTRLEKLVGRLHHPKMP